MYIYNLFVYINVLGTCVSVVVHVLVKMEEAFDTVVMKTLENPLQYFSKNSVPRRQTCFHVKVLHSPSIPTAEINCSQYFICLEH